MAGRAGNNAHAWGSACAGARCRPIDQKLLRAGSRELQFDPFSLLCPPARTHWHACYLVWLAFSSRSRLLMDRFGSVVGDPDTCINHMRLRLRQYCARSILPLRRFVRKITCTYCTVQKKYTAASTSTTVPIAYYICPIKNKFRIGCDIF